MTSLVPGGEGHSEAEVPAYESLQIGLGAALCRRRLAAISLVSLHRSRGTGRRLLAWLFAGGVALCVSLSARASSAEQERHVLARPILLDRVVARFSAPETGGVYNPQFVFERELAFEARLQALADVDYSQTAQGYQERHLRSALELHLAETLLAHLEVSPRVSLAELHARINAARIALEHDVGGASRLADAAQAEGIEPAEVSRLLMRRAQASLYLDRMVAPMLHPTDAELRVVHSATRTPFSNLPFDQVSAALRRWYVSQQLKSAVQAFYEGARARIELTFTQQGRQTQDAFFGANQVTDLLP